MEHHILPSQYAKIDPKEKAFMLATYSVWVERQKKEEQKAKRLK